MKTKTIKQLEKKQAKKEKKIHSIVNKEFKQKIRGQKKNSILYNEKDKEKTNELVNAITKSVILNKRMMGRDKYNLKKWQESYFQELYSEFRKLVEKYNNGLQTKAETLKEKISDLKIEKRRLQDEVRELETKKNVLLNA
jgi:hypothetical protein